MKLIIIAHILVLAIYGCGLIANSDDVKPFIPGVYVRHYTDEYTDSYDTITVQTITPSSSYSYAVIKRSRFEKLNDDDKKVPGYELKHWTGIYDDKTKTIWLQAAGKRIYFDPAKSELKIGTEPYKKLSP
jgi:hypothetical protein